MNLSPTDLRRECADLIMPVSIESAINNCLTHFDYEDAIILAEAYYAKSKSDDALSLYAQCLMRANRTVDAYELLKKEGFQRSCRTRFFYAKCAFELRKLDEADCALRQECGSNDLQLYEDFDESTAGFAHALLAKILSETNRLCQAKKHYGLSVAANPLLWSSIRAYSQMGGENVGKLFGNMIDDDYRQTKNLRKFNDRMLRTKQYFGSESENTVPLRQQNSQTITAPLGKRRKPTFTSPQNPATSPNRTLTRRSSGIGNADKSVVELILLMSEVQEQLSQFHCEEALQLLETVPTIYQNLSFTLRTKGMILFEIPDNKRCADVFRELRRLYPSRIEGMETYSTALWQLQDQHQLSSLAADLINAHRDSPITWCVVGNSLSLQKHHEAAIEAFERAIQLDTRFAYAYSLLGHELAGLNHMSKAAESFRQATIHAPNDYRSLYGQGQVFYKTEEYLNSKAVLNKAVAINPRNTVLLCQLAVVEHALGHNDEAMKHLENALKLEPSSVVCRYHKAKILFDNKDYNAAVQELNELKVLSPDEANVFFLLGRVHRKLNNPHLAMLNFSWATEIDPRGEQNNQSAVSEGPYDDDAADFNDSDRRNTSSGPF